MVTGSPEVGGICIPSAGIRRVKEIGPQIFQEARESRRRDRKRRWSAPQMDLFQKMRLPWREVCHDCISVSLQDHPGSRHETRDFKDPLLYLPACLPAMVYSSRILHSILTLIRHPDSGGDCNGSTLPPHLAFLQIQDFPNIFRNRNRIRTRQKPELTFLKLTKNLSERRTIRWIHGTAPRDQLSD